MQHNEQHPDETAVNREVMRKLYQAGMSGDVDTFFACIHSDFVLNEPPFLHYAGRFRGVDAFKKVFAEVAKFIDLSALELETLVVEGDTAFAVLNARLRDDGTNVALCEEWKLRDGLVVGARVWWWDPEPAIRHAKTTVEA